MSEPVIRMQGIGKRYRIGATPGAAGSRPSRRVRSEEFWALHPLDLEIRRGEVLGIVGGNGAGKSTLLKILARITPPTCGHAEIRGRVGCLLEVGTGFHPELTGRENVYLGGAILGLRRAEIDARLDAILQFAEVGRFLDTPVKRYSSGMRLRLAFAVAAHLEPEILIVDEVLAVGDASFQRRCLGRMGEIAGHGRTVLFVSHNLSAVGNLCSRAIWLDHGALRLDGSPREVVTAYLEHAHGGSSDAERRFGEEGEAPDAGASFERVVVLDPRGRPGTRHGLESPIRFELSFRVERPFENLGICLQVRDESDTVVLASYDSDAEAFSGAEMPLRPREPGVHTARLTLPAPLLNRGSYRTTWLLFEPGKATVSRVEGPSFRVDDAGSFVTRAFQGSRLGVVALPIDWHVEHKPT